jgi:hypothetical protein
VTVSLLYNKLLISNILACGLGALGSDKSLGTRYEFWTLSAWCSIDFKSCIRCLRVGRDDEEMLGDDLVMEGRRGVLLPLLSEEKDEPFRVAAEEELEELLLQNFFIVHTNFRPYDIRDICAYKLMIVVVNSSWL